MDRLGAELAVEMAEVREKFAGESAEARVIPGEGFGQFLERERGKWSDIVKRSEAKVDRPDEPRWASDPDAAGRRRMGRTIEFDIIRVLAK